MVAPRGHVVAPGGHVWLLQGGGGMRGCSLGGMRGCSQGACMVASGGHAWLLRGGVHGCSQGGMHGCSRGGHAWDMMRYGDTINERAVRILLECILVTHTFQSVIIHP